MKGHPAPHRTDRHTDTNKSVATPFMSTVASLFSSARDSSSASGKPSLLPTLMTPSCDLLTAAVTIPVAEFTWLAANCSAMSRASSTHDVKVRKCHSKAPSRPAVKTPRMTNSTARCHGSPASGRSLGMLSSSSGPAALPLFMNAGQQSPRHTTSSS